MHAPMTVLLAPSFLLAAQSRRIFLPVRTLMTDTLLVTSGMLASDFDFLANDNLPYPLARP